MPCSPLKVNWRFGGTYLLHFRGRKISQTRNKRESRWQAGFFLGLLFDPEDRGDMSHRNVCWLSMDYRELCPRRYNSSLLKLFITHAESILHRNTLQASLNTCKTPLMDLCLYYGSLWLEIGIFRQSLVKVCYIKLNKKLWNGLRNICKDPIISSCKPNLITDQ
jgi:hypothetical protein